MVTGVSAMEAYVVSSLETDPMKRCLYCGQ